MNKLFKKLYLVTGLTGVFTGCAIVDPPKDTPARGELTDLVISEIHYNPLPDNTILGDQFEFVELYNRGNSELSLKQVAFTDGIDYTFSENAKIKPGEYLILASNEAEFTRRYQIEPYDQYTGNLKDSGERLAMTDMSVQREFFSIEYGDQSPWPVAADGSGYSMAAKSTDADLSNASQWRASLLLNGSPGKQDPGPVYVNEVMPHTDPPDEDAIELYNPNSVPVDISGWYLTDSKSSPTKYRIPDGTVITADGYKVFYSHDFNDTTLASHFNLSEYGEDVYLVASPSDALYRGYIHGFTFNALENKKTFGRFVNSAGEERFVIEKNPTLGSPNEGPVIKTSSVVFTEIMYNPQNGRDEYIEIKNISDTTVPLFDPKYPVNTWKIEGFGFSFPSNVSLQSGEIAVITSDTITSDEFRSLYNVPSDVKVFSSALGSLRNSCDTIIMLMPLEPSIEGNETVIPYKGIESIAYGDGKAWPSSADGEGSSLIRVRNDQFTDDPNNWKAGSPSPGRDAP